MFMCFSVKLVNNNGLYGMVPHHRSVAGPFTSCFVNFVTFDEMGEVIRVDSSFTLVPLLNHDYSKIDVERDLSLTSADLFVIITSFQESKMVKVPWQE